MPVAHNGAGQLSVLALVVHMSNRTDRTYETPWRLPPITDHLSTLQAISTQKYPFTFDYTGQVFLLFLQWPVGDHFLLCSCAL
jgi:hypothetical protein